MRIEDWLTENKDKWLHDRVAGMKACAEELGCSLKGVQNRAATIWPLGDYPIVPRSKSIPKTKINIPDKNVDGRSDIITAKEFISYIDVVQQIIVFLDNEVKDGYIENERLRRRFEIGTTKWKDIQGLPVFEGRVFVYSKPSGSKATVWSSKQGIELARQTISMARYEL